MASVSIAGRAALAVMMACRTEALGAHVLECVAPGCGQTRIVAPNRCNARTCPQCAPALAGKWSERALGRLPKGPYHHVVVTLPDEFTAQFGYRRKEITRALMRAATRSMLSVMRGKRGGLRVTPAIVAVLHTAGGKLNLHPHVHLLVSAGGLSADRSQWLDAKLDDPLILRLLRSAVRKRFVDAMHFAMATASRRPECADADAAILARLGLIRAQGRKAEVFNVWIGPRRDDPRPIVLYLAKRLYGGPICDERIVSRDGTHVRFFYDDTRDCDAVTGMPKAKIMALPNDEFARRWTVHVPDKGVQLARNCGLMANSKKDALSRAKELLAAVPQPVHSEEPAPAPAPSESVEPPKLSGPRCPACRAPLDYRELIAAPALLPGSVKVYPKPVSLREVLGGIGFGIGPPMRNAA